MLANSGLELLPSYRAPIYSRNSLDDWQLFGTLRSFDKKIWFIVVLRLFPTEEVGVVCFFGKRAHGRMCANGFQCRCRCISVVKSAVEDMAHQKKKGREL